MEQFNLPIAMWKSTRRYRTEVVQYLIRLKHDSLPGFDGVLRLNGSDHVETTWNLGGLQVPNRPVSTRKSDWEAWIVSTLRKDLPTKYSGRATWYIRNGIADPVKLER